MGKCDICKIEGGVHRWFYYPTYMNGDAESLGELCQTHWKEWKFLPNKGLVNEEHYKKFVHQHPNLTDQKK